MLSKPKECEGCPLAPLSTGFIRPVGTGSLGVAIIGEAGGRNEALMGEGFVPWADAGSVLNKAIETNSYTRSQFVFGNIACCTPPNNRFEGEWYEEGAARHCRVHMDRLMSTYKPRVILALGNIALKHLTGLSGKHRTISSLRGYVLSCSRYPGVLIIPSFHPSYLRRGAMKLFRILVQDVGRAVDVAQGKDTNYDLNPRPPKGFNLHPSLEEARSYLRMVQDNPLLRIAYDIETAMSVDLDESEIMWVDEEEIGEGEEERNLDQELFDLARTQSPVTQVQFSVGVGDAICFPWYGEFRTIARDVLRSQNPKLSQNGWRFDELVLGREGVRVEGRPNDDLLWMFHNYQPDLPAHLQFIASFFGQPYPWKHMVGSQMEYYGCVDAEVCHRIYERLPQEMKLRKADWPYAVNNYECYVDHVEKINAIMERVSQRGIPINDEARVEFGKDLDVMKGDYYGQLDSLYPMDLREAEPKAGFVRTPKEVVEATNWFGQLTTCTGPDLDGIIENGWDAFVQGTTGLQRKHFNDTERVFDIVETECTCKKGCKKCGHTRVLAKRTKTDKWTEVEVERWYRPRKFKPSYNQVGAYILAKGHKMPKRVGAKREERQKPSTGKLGLMQLFKTTRDPFYKLVVDYRNVEKLKSTYVDGWAPLADGRVHSTYTCRPATHQLSSVNPNVQNSCGEKGGELGVRFKNVVEARPGRTLVEIDFTGLHAYMLGYLAKDLTYMRLASLGIHDYVAAHMLRKETNEEETKDYLRDLDRWLALDDDELSERLSWIKDKHKVFRSKVKPCIAEGQLVLTNEGLVPIERVQLHHKLWDGVEWVPHEGVVFKGYKEVIEHDGLIATPDHKVYTRSGWALPLWKAKREGLRLESTGLGRQEVRTSYDNFRGDEESEGILASSCSLSNMWLRELARLTFFNTGSDTWMQALRTRGKAVLQGTEETWRALRRYISALYEPEEAQIRSLWRPWDTMQLCFEGGFCEVDAGELASQGLYWGGDRSNRQRWSLRTGEFEASYSQTKQQQPANNGSCYRRGPSYSSGRVEEPIWDRPHQAISQTRANCTADSGTRQGGGAQFSEKLADYRGKVAVYDIVNAGPRHRFTVENKGVANCVHGYGFGIGAKKLFDNYPESFAKKAEAQAIIDMLNTVFPKVAQYREDIKEEAQSRGYLMTPYGAIRHFSDVFDFREVTENYVPKYGEKLFRTKSGKLFKKGAGQDAEKAIAFLPAACSFGYKKDALLMIAERGWDEKYWLINEVHDSVLFECPDQLVDECLENVMGVMQHRSRCLVDEEIAPEGLVCRAAASVGKRWGAMKEVR